MRKDNKKQNKKRNTTQDSRFGFEKIPGTKYYRMTEEGAREFERIMDEEIIESILMEMRMSLMQKYDAVCAEDRKKMMLSLMQKDDAVCVGR